MNPSTIAKMLETDILTVKSLFIIAAQILKREIFSETADQRMIVPLSAMEVQEPFNKTSVFASAMMSLLRLRSVTLIVKKMLW
jgi:hypothetical protein